MPSAISGFSWGCSLDALFGELYRIGKGGVGQGEGGCQGNRSRHIGNAVMDDALHFIRWLVMGGRVGSFKASALVNGYIHQHRSLFHGLEHLPSDESGRLGPRQKDRTYYYIGFL